MTHVREHPVEAGVDADARHAEAILKTGALQRAIFNSANFSSIATDAKGVIQIFNVGGSRDGLRDRAAEPRSYLRVQRAQKGDDLQDLLPENRRDHGGGVRPQPAAHGGDPRDGDDLARRG